jgi:hypothetical protein
MRSTVTNTRMPRSCRFVLQMCRKLDLTDHVKGTCSASLLVRCPFVLVGDTGLEPVTYSVSADKVRPTGECPELARGAKLQVRGHIVVCGRLLMSVIIRSLC